MEIQKLLKTQNKIQVVSDFREREVAEHLKRLGIFINEMGLEVGDFICSDDVCIERKTYNDFVSSIVDGRIFEQAENMKKNFERPILIIEGYSNREISENALRSAIAALLVDFGITLLNTKNPLDTAKTIFWIAKREQEEKKKGLSIRVGKKPPEERRLQEFIVAGIPRISLVLARRLLEHFGSIENIVAAEENELVKINGIGKLTAKRIKKILTLKY